MAEQMGVEHYPDVIEVGVFDPELSSSGARTRAPGLGSLSDINAG